MKCSVCKGFGEEKIIYDSHGIDYNIIQCRVCGGSGKIAPRVLNKHNHGIPRGAVYIGRGSFYGNPFEIGRDGTREEVISKYIEWFSKDIERINKAKLELRDTNLVCYCAPEKCHGDFLLKLANEIA